MVSRLPTLPQTRKLRLKAASPTLSSRVNAIAALGETTFTANRSRVLVWVRGKLAKELTGHASHVELLYVFGTLLVSIDKDNMLLLWDIETLERVSADALNLGSGIRIRSIVHPATYLNKLVLGTESGKLLLWNVKYAVATSSFSWILSFLTRRHVQEWQANLCV